MIFSEYLAGSILVLHDGSRFRGGHVLVGKLLLVDNSFKLTTNPKKKTKQKTKRFRL